MLDVKVLFRDLVRLEVELWDAVEARLLDDCDLPLTWFEPMQVIQERDGCRVYDIAKELSITVGGTSKLVDRIEAAGLCRRRPNPDDARSSIIELTPAGRRRLASATEALEDEVATRLAPLVSAQALQRFASTLRTLRGGLRGAPLDGSAPSTVS
jgi:DNA-binding MarR family transcriptional regulator